MKNKSKLINMIFTLVIFGVILIAFLFVLVKYEKAKPYLPTPTPVVTPTNSPTPTSTPTPTPGYTRTEWNRLFNINDTAFTVTETITDAEGLTLTNTYKFADGMTYKFTQTSEKAATEEWYIVSAGKYLYVSGTLDLNKQGGFVVNKKGYKSANSTAVTVAAVYDSYVKKAKEFIEKYHEEIPFTDYKCIDLFKKYETVPESLCQSTIKIKDGKIVLFVVTYEEETTDGQKKTINVSIVPGTVTGEEILESSPKK